ncbi:Hypothetical protein A7982_08089 [Minicystis rosea]|nr:Hypothetical protein A7982_08089 [Minicystis rosea]
MSVGSLPRPRLLRTPHFFTGPRLARHPRPAVLALFLLVLPGCGFTKAIGIGTGAAGLVGTAYGFGLLYDTAKRSISDEKVWAARATEKGWATSGALLGCGAVAKGAGMGLFFLSEEIEKALNPSPVAKPINQAAPPQRESPPGEYEVKPAP